MDPNLFHLDWERTLEALVGVIVLSFLVERVWALLFESHWWIRNFEDPRVDSSGGETVAKQAKIPAAKRVPLKEFLAFGLALIVCLRWEFDVVSIIFLTDQTGKFGLVLTAAIIAGGSKSSVVLFQDVMGVMSSAQKERRRLKDGDV